VLLRGGSWRTSRCAAQAIAIGDPCGIRGHRGQSRGVPVLPAPDAPPVVPSLDRVLGHGRGRMTHRTPCRSQDVRLIIERRCCRVRS
jgi:hypothetical protein